MHDHVWAKQMKSLVEMTFEHMKINFMDMCTCASKQSGKEGGTVMNGHSGICCGTH